MESISSLYSIFTYIAMGYGLYCLARTCGLQHPWMSWVPFCNIYLLGAMADHYSERNQSRKTYNRHILLWMQIGMSVLAGIAIGILVKPILDILIPLATDTPNAIPFETESELFNAILSGVLSSLALWMVLLGLSIVYLVFYFMTLNRIYKLFVPESASTYTFLSVFIAPIPVLFLLMAKKTPIYTDSYDHSVHTSDPYADSAPHDGPYSL